MTPTFCCGFECGLVTVGTHLSGFVGTAPTISTTTVRSGSRSLRFNLAAQSGSCTANIAQNVTTSFVTRVYIYFDTLPSANTNIVTAGASGTTAGIFFQVSDGKLYARANGTLGSTGIAVQTGQWYCLDLFADASFAAGLGWSVSLSVNGVAAATATNVLGATTGWVHLGAQSSVTANIFYDDWILSETGADYPIGPGHVHHFVPTSDGTHNIAGTGDFQRGNTGVDILNATTTAYQLVDDVPLPSGTVDQADCWRAVAPANPTTDYVHGVFGPASGIPTPAQGPRAVDVIIAHHQIATQNGEMEVLLDDNGTTGVILDTGVVAGVTTYRYARAKFATPPTGGSWTVAGTSGNFNLVGCRFRAPDAAPDQCLDAIMIEAEFADPPELSWDARIPAILNQPNSVVSYGLDGGIKTT